MPVGAGALVLPARDGEWFVPRFGLPKNTCLENSCTLKSKKQRPEWLSIERSARCPTLQASPPAGGRQLRRGASASKTCRPPTTSAGSQTAPVAACAWLSWYPRSPPPGLRLQLPSQLQICSSLWTGRHIAALAVPLHSLAPGTQHLPWLGLSRRAAPAVRGRLLCRQGASQMPALQPHTCSSCSRQ